MDAAKKAKLEAKGFNVGTAAEFLGLSPEEQAVIDMRIALSRNLRSERLSQGIQQAELAAKAKTTQKRISLMESGDSSISLDKLFAANFALGIPPFDVLQRVSASISESYADYRPVSIDPARRRVTRRHKGGE